VELNKDKLEFQEVVDVTGKMDMCCKVKLFDFNIHIQVVIVLKPFLDFMNNFKLSKAHNMLMWMLDLWFKNLNLVGEYVGQKPAIEIVVIYDNQFFLPLLKTLCYKLHGHQNTLYNVVQNIACNINAIFGVGVF
jgi:hypothetical protein